MENDINYSERQLMEMFLQYIDDKILIEVKPIDSWDGWIYKVYGEDAMSPFCLLYQDNTEYKTYYQALNAGVNYCQRNNF